MTINKRKKNTRQRARTTHGWGSMKKRRGAGNRGGRGRAGSGKRGDCKKQRYEIAKEKFGKFGFTSKKVSETINYVNISELSKEIESYVEKKIASVENDVYTIDLSKINKQKLLGKGLPEHKFNITVKYATKKAVEKLQANGSTITVVAQKTEEKDQ